MNPGVEFETEVRSGAGPSLRRCRHCGTGFRPRFDSEEFCCGGCRVVSELIRDSGYSSFYDLLGARTLDPVASAEAITNIDPDTIEAIDAAEQDAVASNSAAKLKFRVGNLSCTACVWLIDRLFRERPGALKVSSDTGRSVLTTWWTPGEFDMAVFLADLRRFGYPASVFDESIEDEAGESRALLTRLGTTGAFALNAMGFTLPIYLGLETSDDLARLFGLVAFASATLAMAVGGSYFFAKAFAALRHRVLHMDVPIALGLAAAYGGSLVGYATGAENLVYFDFVATFAFLMLAGRWLHLRLLEKNRRQLRARDRHFVAVTRLSGEARKKIPLSRIVSGDRIEIAPDGIVPVDAVLITDRARFGLDWITGEPDPVESVAGRTLQAGARNVQDSPVEVEASHDFSGSLLEKLLATPDDDGVAAPASTPLLKGYLIIVLVLAFVGAAGWVAIAGAPATALQVFVSVLVVSCPCALGLALPLLDETVLSRLRREGVFIRGSEIWRRLRNIRMLAFDKTGTLTEPVSRIRDGDEIDRLDHHARRALGYLVQRNPHPVAKAIREELIARRGRMDAAPVVSVEEIAGKGVSCRVEGVEWRLGRAGWSGSGGAGTVLSRDGEAVASFHAEEALREGVEAQISRWRNRGLGIYLLSGDPDENRVGAIAKQLDIGRDEFGADLSPEKKAEVISRLGADHICYVGDGGNDGPALDAAQVSGTPATGIRAVESRADFVFTGRGFRALDWIFVAEKKRRVLGRTIFSVAVLYNAAAVGLALTGVMSPLLAAVLMPLSSIVTLAIAGRGGSLDQELA